MTKWTVSSLWQLDQRFAEEGVLPHQRPMRAALEILRQKHRFIDIASPEVKEIVEAYEAILPEARQTWSGMGIGLVAVVDQVRRVKVPVVFGRGILKVSQGLGTSEREWWAWCREDKEIAAQTVYAFTDVLDLAYGLHAIRGGSGRDLPLWRLALSNLSDCASVLPVATDLDSVVQSIFMTVELSLKAALVRNGADPDSFRRKGGEGHHVLKLAERLAKESSHRDDERVAAVADSLPPYVESRYRPRGLSRLEVTTLALGAQFVAASAVRRLSGCDLAAELNADSWPPLLKRDTATRAR